jgi:hypothetical protein
MYWIQQPPADTAKDRQLSGKYSDSVEQICSSQDTLKIDESSRWPVAKHSIDPCWVANGASSVCAYCEVKPVICSSCGSTPSARRGRLLLTITSRIVWTDGIGPLARIDTFCKFRSLHLSHDNSSSSDEKLDDRRGRLLC